MNGGTAISEDAIADEASAPTRRLVEILVTSLEALAGAGNAELACRLAGQACVTLRRSDRKAARRFDALLHRLTKKLSW